ncbi:MAG: 2-hydroxychromene-2-carboxylate isomerase [Pseudomonadota bacterium]|nr:2-hydroxychromene-2-carboxylate isomerase [Pseudomonadota bacterium]
MADTSPYIEFCFDYISPYSYLAATQMPALSEQLGIPVIWQPVNLPRLIKLSGNTPPATIRNKARYLLRDLKQWSQHLDVPFRMIMPGSFDSRLALASSQALDDQNREILATAVFKALWADGIDYLEQDWLGKAVAAADLPGEWILSDAYSQQMDEVNSQTAAIHKAGAFGVPTYFLRGAGRTQMFWGIDRLDFLVMATEKALKRI